MIITIQPWNCKIIIVCVCVCVSVFDFGRTHSSWKFPGQGSNLSRSCSLHHSYGSARSLTHFAGPGTKPAPPPRQHQILNPPRHSGSSILCVVLRHQVCGNLLEKQKELTPCPWPSALPPPAVGCSNGPVASALLLVTLSETLLRSSWTK